MPPRRGREFGPTPAPRLPGRCPGLSDVFVIMIGVVRLLLAALYEIEVALRAAAYWWFSRLNSPEGAILYSVDSIGTRRASGLPTR